MVGWLVLAGGFVPALLCSYLLYWLDRYEKEPKRLVGGIFLWGAFFATLVAGIAQMVLQTITEVASGSRAAGVLAGATLFAPVTEEVLKGLAVFLVFAVLRHEFDSLLDGIVYTGVVALGFAATENALYLYSGYRADGGEGLIQVFVGRVVLGIWDHPLYTSFFGMGLAISRLSRRLLVRVVAPLAGLALSVTFHSLHNSLIVLFGGLLAALALLVDWLGWVFLAIVIIAAARAEGRLVARELVEEVDAGMLSARQLHVASSSLRRMFAVGKSLRRGRFRATTGFYQACAELAHKKNQLRKVGEERGTSERILGLCDAIREAGRTAVC
jgi:RsiW-degrading membrane proteinase PrsW (M82 family)